MSRKSKPSKISIRPSIFPNVSPYIEFTSCIHNHHLPDVRTEDYSLNKEIIYILLQTLSVAASQGLDYFYSVKENLHLANITPVKVRFLKKFLIIILCLVIGIRQMFHWNLGKLLIDGERLR